MDPTPVKLICAALIFILSVVFGFLPLVLSRKFPLLSHTDPNYNKKARRNVANAFLLNFGGGVLLANCFCHWLPEVREAIEAKDIETFVPLAEVITCAGFFFVCFLEELIHHCIHPRKKKEKHRGKNESPEEEEADGKEFEKYDIRLKEAAHHEANKVEHEQVAFEVSDTAVEDDSSGERTKSLLRTAFVVSALSFHSVIEGLALTMEEDTSGVWINFAAIAMHKFVIAFSLGVELVSSKATRGQFLVSIAIFSLAPVIGVGIGIALSEYKAGEEAFDELPLDVIQAIAIGTVLYVVFFEIFPKAKEIGGTGFQQVISMTVGFGAFLPSLMFHTHHHDDEHGSHSNETCHDQLNSTQVPYFTA